MSAKTRWRRVFDWIAEQVSEAVTDIRRQVVEEPWFGRPQDSPASQTPRSAWDWKPDTRAIDALREKSPDIEGRNDPPSPATTDRGIDI